MSADQGYRDLPRGGPRVRTDVVDVYVFRARAGGGFEFLQVRRADEPLAGTWHPVMGHIEAGETAVQCAKREMQEELGLRVDSPMVRGMWALEQVHPFYIAAIDCIVMSPRFAVLVGDPAASDAQSASAHRSASGATTSHKSADAHRSASGATANHPEWRPTLSEEHSAFRWVGQDEPEKFMWPGQRAAVREIVESLMAEGAACGEWLRVR